jgi:hypothetical protein
MYWDFFLILLIIPFHLLLTFVSVHGVLFFIVFNLKRIPACGARVTLWMIYLREIRKYKFACSTSVEKRVNMDLFRVQVLIVSLHFERYVEISSIFSVAIAD